MLHIGNHFIAVHYFLCASHLPIAEYPTGTLAASWDVQRLFH